MKNLQKLLEAIDFIISDGAKFQWDCFPNGRFINARVGDDVDCGEVSAIVDGQNDVIYQIEVWPADDALKTYRWTNPDWKQAYTDEATQRGIDPNVYCDDKRFADTDDLEDILTKANAVIRGKAFDTRVVMQFDLDETVHKELLRRAEEAGMDFDRFMELILHLEIARVESEDNKGSA